MQDKRHSKTSASSSFFNRMRETKPAIRFGSDGAARPVGYYKHTLRILISCSWRIVGVFPKKVSQLARLCCWIRAAPKCSFPLLHDDPGPRLSSCSVSMVCCPVWKLAPCCKFRASWETWIPHRLLILAFHVVRSELTTWRGADETHGESPW